MIQTLRVTVAALLLLAGVSTAYAADLSDEQRDTLSKVVSGLNKGVDNYNLALESAGPGSEKPKGSKAKLAQIRLDSAKQALDPASSALAELPADNADVAAAQKQYEQLASACAALQARLDGESASASAPKPKQPDRPEAPKSPSSSKQDDAAAGDQVKLDYKQEEVLKRARYNLTELEGFNKTLAAWAEKANAVEDKSMIQWSEAQGIGELIAKAKTRVQYASDALKELPGNGKGVSQEAARHSILTAELQDNIKQIEPVYRYVAKIADTASYPTLQEDLRKMRGLSSMYASTQVLENDPEQAEAAIKQGPAAWKEFQAFAQTYGPLSNQQSQFGKEARGAGLGFASNYKKFAEAMQAKAKELPGQIEQHLAEAQKDASIAVDEKKPAYFNGGVEQKMNWARDKQKMLAVIDAEAAKPTAAKLAAAEADIRKKQESLREHIIAANRMPADKYSHPDRKVIEAKAIEAWKKRDPDARILAVRMPVENWKRSRKLWLRDGVLSETDASYLQVQLVVQHDDKLAVMRPIDLKKDHTMNDQLFATPFDAEDRDLNPGRYMLLKNVK